MAVKPIKWYIKLQIKWGQANPAPPVWPALGQYWVPIQDFISKFNEQTKDKMWKLLPVVITVYEDRSFEFVVKQQPVWELIKEKLNLKSGSKVPQRDKVWHLTMEQLKEIAEIKIVDMNAIDTIWAMKTIDGTARQMWITSDIHWMDIKELRAKLN